jgi:hypothetical protein
MDGVGPGLESSGVGVFGGCRVVVQRGLSLLLVPVSMSSSFSQISAEVAVNMTLHPASQSWPMEIRLVLPRAGNKWAVLAGAGSCGMSTWAVWVDCIVVPSGNDTWMPLLLLSLFVCGAWSDRK